VGGRSKKNQKATVKDLQGNYGESKKRNKRHKKGIKKKKNRFFRRKLGRGCLKKKGEAPLGSKLVQKTTEKKS